MKNTVVIVLLLLFMTSCESLMLATSGEDAADFRVVEDKVYVNGVLGKKAYRNFMDMLEQYPNAQTLILQEVPGSISDEWNVKICKEVRNKGMDTYLESTSVIQSGGVDLFIAGVKRYAESGTQIGVHAWRDLRKGGDEYPPESKEHDIFVDYFKVIEQGTSFYWFTLHAAPAGGMHFMTKEEIDEYNLVTDWVDE